MYLAKPSATENLWHKVIFKCSNAGLNTEFPFS